MFAFLSLLFDTSDFPARWDCGNWSSAHGWTHVIADFMIFASYVAIPLALAYLTLRRTVPAYPSILWLFVAFIFCCGLGHLVESIIFWTPIYRVSAVIKVITALVSLTTAAVLIPLIPRLMELRSPQELQREVARRTQQLQDSEARLKSIIETAADGILTLDRHWTIRTANSSCRRLFGLAPEQMIGEQMQLFVLSIPQTNIGTGESAILGMGGDLLGRRADGTTFPITVSISKVQGSSTFTAIVHDLSQLRTAEEALHLSEKRLLTLLEQVPVILCSTDAELRITLLTSSASVGLSGVNLASTRYRGAPLLEDDHDPILQAIPRTAFQKAVQGTLTTTETTWEDRTFQFHAQPLRNSKNQITGTIGVGVDITELKRTENALRSSEAQIRALVAAAADGIITITDQGIVLSVNPACEKLFGYRAEELIGKKINQLMPSPDREFHDRYLKQYLETGQNKVIGIGREVTGRRKDGSRFPADLSVGEVKLRKHRLFIGIVRDITDRKRTEQALKRYARQLKEKNAQLVRSNEELDEFAYVASHDLKEPLRGIHNYSQFLIEDYGEQLDEEGRHRLRTLKSLTEHMEGFIESLLHFSRVGRVEVAVQHLDLSALVHEVLGSLRISLEQHGTEVRICGDLPTLHGDRVRIGEVYRNLITNALKYNDKPRKWIEIGAVRADQAGIPAELRQQGGPPHEQILYVRDNGIGIPQKHHEAIFRIFRRLHGRTQFGGGTGAGLTIVKKIIERHGGLIFLESEPGVGTTFYFTIPKPRPTAEPL